MQMNERRDPGTLLDDLTADCRFLIDTREIQVAPTGFEPMTCAKPVQYQLSYEATQLGAG